MKLVQTSIGGRAEREREKKTNVAGRWAGPIVQRGPNRGVENKETWGGERPKKKKKKKETTKYHVARGRKLRDFFFDPGKGGPEPKKREREREKVEMMKTCRGTRKGKSPLDFRISDKIHRLRGGLEMKKKKKEKKLEGEKRRRLHTRAP